MAIAVVFGTNRIKPHIVITGRTVETFESHMREQVALAWKLKEFVITIHDVDFWIDDFMTDGKVDIYKRMRVLTEHQYEVCQKFLKQKNNC